MGGHMGSYARAINPHIAQLKLDSSMKTDSLKKSEFQKIYREDKKENMRKDKIHESSCGIYPG